MKISALQMKITIGDIEKNIETLKRMIDLSMKEQPDVIVLPELWDIGFFPTPLKNYTDSEGTRTKTLLSELSKKYNVNIIGGSIAEETEDVIKNTCYIFNREGNLIGDYSKSHLFSPAKEEKSFCCGKKLTTFTLDNVKCGIIICYDLRFPELTRRLALDDIDVLFVTSQWPTARLYHWQTLLKARAIENQIFIAACNASGAFANKMELAGNSIILDPWGEVLAQADKNEEIISASIDLAIKEKIRTTINVFADRNTTLY